MASRCSGYAEVDPGHELALLADLVLGNEARVASVEQQPGNPRAAGRRGGGAAATR